ncbi:MAG: FkbM family methyltransferase [Pseudomonadota bacterium]
MGLRSKFRNWVRKEAFQRGTLITLLVDIDTVRLFLARFRAHYVPVELIRIGGDGDGGYLLPDILENVEFCFSPGVEYVAHFERELSNRYGIRSFMADASVDSAPMEDDNFQFIPKFIGNRTHGNFVTLSDWVEQSVGQSTGARILQMDIEGGEYDVLMYESVDSLAQFSTIIVEFHWLQRMFEPNFFQTFATIFEKIYRNFSICHAHPNNCCGIAEYKNVQVPRVLEVTFVRNDLIEGLARHDQVRLPHPLDRKNVPANDELVMPKIWWRGD